MRYITHIRLSGGDRLEHITRVRWVDGLNFRQGESSREEMVRWIDDGGDARVKASPRDVSVHVVRASPPYLRTAPNDSPYDNLLTLPRF
ncbi:DUF3892 domain-containing protein [Myxococcus stipitatus]|uniref:DUF3892 domain-containing protein n=1 Tax=Myxococcus stipitatus TaxID=83455 RepID=UPI001F44DF1F|nr:DUF3892 domain-containing protein [Myxococcus stipitatus]MCE9672617.1 DUF3892 domain-containing protein [Myxococcus stipitatus]